MIRTKPRLRSPFRLLTSGSLSALALAASLAPSIAHAQAFGTMVGMQAGRTIGPNGQVSVWSGADRPVIGTDKDGRPLMTIQQNQQKALLDWEDFRLQTNEVLEFRQQASNWIAVNRVHGAQAAEINGEIRAPGQVYVFNDNGVLIGKDAKINTRTLVTGRGFSDVNVDGKTTTIVQSAEKGILDWSNMSLQAGEVLKFQQEKANWIALNRSYNTDTTKLAGDIKADGNIYLVAPRGISVDGKIDAQQVVLSSLFMRDDQFLGSGSMGGLMSYARDYNGRMDPSFSNSWYYPFGTSGYNPLGQTEWVSNANYYDLMGNGPEASDPNDPLKYNVTVGRNAVVSTGAFGKVMLFGPKVTNKGTINVKDEGQVILAAGENIYLAAAPGGNGMLEAYVGAYNPLSFMRANIPYYGGIPPQYIADERWRDLYNMLLGGNYQVGDTLPYDQYQLLIGNGYGPDGVIPGFKLQNYINQRQTDRARAIGYTARNEGIISAKRGGSVDFRGLDLEQMGAVDITSTALFRGSVSFKAFAFDYMEYYNGSSPDSPGYENAIKGNGTVTFGKGSLTQITPDLDSTDMIPVGSGPQSVGSLSINANSVYMQQDSLIYMPSGNMQVLLDAGAYAFRFGMNRGPGANLGNEDGTRFLMDAGATIDLSGWHSTLEMGYHQVTGKLFAAQLADSPVQRDGPLYRKEITVDRRFGTNLANWQSFDNLSQGTLAQFLTDGGTLNMDIGDDFIMKSGSVIDVSGGVTTYKDGYVYTTLLRRLDGSVIDIREADPDEIYMGLANEWVVYDTKWGKQTSYYIPLVSSVQGKYETSYQQGGKGGKVAILAPDAVLQGTLKGDTVAGRYQRDNIPAGGSFTLGDAADTEGEYVSNTVLIAATENALDASFGLHDRLSDTYGDLFGVEFDPEHDPVSSDDRHSDNLTLASADFFNRSSMGSYEINQRGRVSEQMVNNAFVPLDGVALLVEHGADLNLANGASLTLAATERMEFLGSIRTEGGDVSLSGMSLKLAADTRIDTRGSWYSDYEVEEPIALTSLPRIDGGSISLFASGSVSLPENVGLVLPETAVLDASGGAWVNRDGVVKGGKGGNLSITYGSYSERDALDLGAVAHARAYGLAGNGAFSLTGNQPIVIGDALPEVDGEPADPDTMLLIRPDFFTQSGFSAITLWGASVTLSEGTQVQASSLVMKIQDQTLHNGRPPAFWTPSGTDIYDVTEIVDQPLAQRPEALRRGMDISLIGTTYIQKDSLLATAPGGSIRLGGSAEIAGTLLAPAGQINVDAGRTENGSAIHIASTGKLLAPGSSLITWRGVDAVGKELVDGEIYNGGTIRLSADNITLDQGALLDVSGVSATFDIEVDDGRGGAIRQPTKLASNGGVIALDGAVMQIDGADYRASAGGAGARGGSFLLDWQVNFGTGGGGGGGWATPQEVLDSLEMYFSWGLFTDMDGNPVTSLYGTDLSKINWAPALGFQIDFAPGTLIADRDSIVGTFAGYEAAAKGIPPMFIIGSADGLDLSAPELPAIDPGISFLFSQFGYMLPTPVEGDPVVTVLSPEKIGKGGFSSMRINAAPGVIFSGDVNLGGRKADGSYLLDTLTINAQHIIGREGAHVSLEAGVVNIDGTAVGQDNGYLSLLAGYGVQRIGEDTTFTAKAGTLLSVGIGDFYGFSDTNLISGGDIRFAGYSEVALQAPSGSLYTPGKLTMKADQIYAGTGRIFSVLSDTGIEIQAQDDGGPINGSPYEAAAQLTLKAPTIVQGGTLRSPLGTLTLEVYDNGTEGSNRLILAPGSLTSVSAEGRTIPYGLTSNGDTWIDPFTGLELTALPTKTVNLTGGTVDIQAGATLDVSGGGDLFAREFVPGVGGTVDWLTGYRDADYKWVEAPGEIYAIVPGYDGNIAPLGFGASQIGVGDKVYLSGGSGLPAGTYVLLPAEYALLPGAYRVVANHRYGDFTDARLGKTASLTDGSSIQSGYRIDGASGARDQRNMGFHVMNGDTLRKRSSYLEVTANNFFTSEAFLRKSLRVNRPVADVPRIPIDGGSVVFRVGETLDLDGTLKSAAGKGGRGGFADIASAKVVVAGADTDLGQYDGYLILNSDQLNAFGAESLLIGGVRQQGDVNLELAVTGTDVVIDNAGSTLFGPELLFASNGKIDVKSGASLETRGAISGSSSDLRILPQIAAFTHDNDTSWDPNDDYLVHGVLDQGAVLRVSSGNQVDVLRDGDAVNAMNALRNDPARLASVNAARASKGLAPIDASGGLLTIADGASIKSGRSVALDATNDTRLGAGATLQTQQLSASASRVSIGAVPEGMEGLVFAAGALGTLGNAADLTLKSYSSIDLYGPVALSATGGLRLDTAEIRVIANEGDAAKIGAKTLTLANSTGLDATAVAGGATLTLDATNLYIEGGEKWISGVSGVTIAAAERVIGRDDTALHLPGTLAISTGGLTAESSARLNLDAAGAIRVMHNGNAGLPAFESFGGTLALTGASIDYAGQTRITGGTINLQARSGDVTLAEGAVLDVTSNVSRFYDQSVGVGAGAVNLIADQGDVVARSGSLIDVSGTSVGGDGGTLTVQAGLGEARLDGTLRGDAAKGYSSGSFSLLTQELADFAGFNARLDTGGFRHSRRFEINHGDVTVDGTIEVQNFAVVTNDGSIDVTGTVATTGDSGGRIQLSAARDVTLAGTAQLFARARTADGAGGTVLLETTGAGGGRIETAAGSRIDVSGTGEGGRLVRFRAPQVGNDIGIGSLAGTITGARSVIAEGYRVYDGVAVIDQGMIDQVEGDASAFMSANAAAIRSRLGSGVMLTAGIELRNAGDMRLATDWDLSGVRFDGAPGVLTLRAGGDLKIDANLTDGFLGTALMDGESWTFNLTGGANIVSPDSMAVLGRGLLAPGAGSVIIGGTPDTIDYYYDPAFGNENRLYLLDANGRFARDLTGSSPSGFIELTRDDATGKYIDPITGALIEKDPATGDYADTSRYARRPLPWIYYDGYSPSASYRADGSWGYVDVDGNGYIYTDMRMFQQWDNSTGYRVRTGTGAINVAAGADLILSQRQSVIYTAGRVAPEVADFIVPAGAQYGERGGDLTLRVAGDILASSQVPQLPSGYLGRRYALDDVTGLFTGQPSWWVNYETFEGGVGALGGGNIAIEAGGDIDNLGVSIPNSARVSGNIVKRADGSNDPVSLTLTGGGDLTLKAGGNILGSVFYVAEGKGDITAGGSILAGSKARVFNDPSCTVSDPSSCYIHFDPRATAPAYDVYTMLYTSSGQFDVKSGGDLNIDGVLDPMLTYDFRSYDPTLFTSYTDTAAVRLFSAGGDVVVWNNNLNTAVVAYSSGPSLVSPSQAPLFYYGRATSPDGGRDAIGWDIRPPQFSAIAATGDVRIVGGMTLMPAPRGNLELMAGNDVLIGYSQQSVQFGLPGSMPYLPDTSQRGNPVYQGIYMSQSDPELIRNTTSTFVSPYGLGRQHFRNAGQGGTNYLSILPFSIDNPPDLHVGDTDPVRIYAVHGDIVTAGPVELYLPKQAWFQAGGNIYFPSYSIQHNNPNDLSIVRAGKGVYFDIAGTFPGDVNNGLPQIIYGKVEVAGPGRLEVEAGTDIYMPNNVGGGSDGWTPPNGYGITSRRITVDPGAQAWHADEKAADIAVSTGFNQTPSYQAFEDAYLDPTKAGEMEDYLIDPESGKSLYLFDREYPRARGATGEFAVPEPREGLVNYVRRLQGLDPLKTKAEQMAYLDTAWSYWQSLGTDFKTPYYRSVLFLELRTTGREANDPESERFETTSRGYKAIETLFPGAQKEPGTALADGESAWRGDFETYANRVMSTGGGKIEFVIPGGSMILSNVAARPGETGQPTNPQDRGNALRAGIVTTDGGEINILSQGSVVVNESRILTSKGGNVMIWSSWGDIAAGKGAKTSISPPFYNYALDNWGRMKREPAGLPTGAGIGTLATQPGTPPADVDLIAPAGIVDAGDAGIRVSGNFNVYAIEILGTDNIDVAGVATGLPAAPATPPNSLDTGEVGAKAAAVSKALDEAVAQVRKNAAITSPSIIEVHVVTANACGPADSSCDGPPARTGNAAPVVTRAAAIAPTLVAMRSEAGPPPVAFDLPPQPLDQAVRAIGRTAKVNIVYDSDALKTRTTQPLRGSMSVEEALRKLLSDQDLVPVQISPTTIVLRRRTI